MKKCDLCDKNPAVMTVRQMDKDGKVTEFEVCADCARKRGFAEAEKIKMSVAEVLAEVKGKTAEEDRNLVCPRCGMSFADFKRLGRLGCADCYEHFRSKLEPLIRRIHGAVQHVGKTTRTGRKQAQLKMNTQRLREELQDAIHAENYEKAAKLRDQLKRAKNDART